jgi:hypothetical protein
MLLLKKKRPKKRKSLMMTWDLDCLINSSTINRLLASQYRSVASIILKTSYHPLIRVWKLD